MKKKKSKNKIIRSTSHDLHFANHEKLITLKFFLSDYRIALQNCIDFIWNSSFSFKDKIFDISKDFLDLPLFIDYKLISNNTKLSARAFCSALEQALNIIRSQITKRKNLLWVKAKLIKENKNISYIQNCLDKTILTKPKISSSIGAELSSKCIDFDFSSKHFNSFIRLSSTGFDHIKLPTKYHKANKKLKDFTLLKGILITENKLILRWQNEVLPKDKGKVVGLDTGIKNTITLSDTQTSKPDIHHHTLESICKKLSRKEKGSKAFKRAQEHRTNYINWSINQIDFSDIKQINLEKVNLFKGKRSRFISHFSHREISFKLKNIAEELGVQVNLQSCTYRSQRCSGCGIVYKKNRRGKIYECKFCGMILDADLNAAINHEIELPRLPKAIIFSKLNLHGFLWNPCGIYNIEGQDLGVSDT